MRPTDDVSTIVGNLKGDDMLAFAHFLFAMCLGFTVVLHLSSLGHSNLSGRQGPEVK